MGLVLGLRPPFNPLALGATPTTHVSGMFGPPGGQSLRIWLRENPLALVLIFFYRYRSPNTQLNSSLIPDLSFPSSGEPVG